MLHIGPGQQCKVLLNVRVCDTAVGLRKTSLLHKQIKNHATLAYKNSVRKCYQDMFFYYRYVV